MCDDCHTYRFKAGRFLRAADGCGGTLDGMGDKPRAQQTQPQGIDPETGKPYEPIEIPVPKREDVEDALDRLIEAEAD
jgi:hypothetical protein